MCTDSPLRNVATVIGLTKFLVVVLGTLGIVIVCVAPAQAEPVLGPNAVLGANGHYYDIVFKPDGGTWTWTDAKNDAVARGGHLATVNSAQEKMYIESHLDFASSFDTSMFNFGFGPFLGGFLVPHASTDPNNPDAGGNPGAPRGANGHLALDQWRRFVLQRCVSQRRAHARRNLHRLAGRF